MVEPVADFTDARLDDYRNIPDPELIERRGIFVAEGRLVVTRLLAAPEFTVRSLLLTAPAREAVASALALRPDVPVYEVSQSTMNQVTGFNLHRGCLAIGIRPSPRTPESLAANAGRLVALEGVANADNVGSIFRSGAALRADGVLLDAVTTDPFYRKALRTSMGAVLQLPFARTSTWLDTLTAFQARGITLVALTPRADAPSLAQVAHELAGSPVAIVVGHEGEGLTAATLARCDRHARIPMRPDVDSLNVATATAIALYELTR